MSKTSNSLNSTNSDRPKTEDPACDLCGRVDKKVLYSVPDIRLRRFDQEYTVVECAGCGHRFLSPRPSRDNISDHYPDTYYDGRSTTDPRQKKRYLIQAQYLPDVKEGRILDVGCAGGSWLKVVQNYGWECHGVDFMESPHQESGITIKHGYLPETGYPESYFDVACAWGVMEHVHEPSKYFEYINRVLKDKGLFIFMVPNGDSLWSRWAYKEDIPRHLHFFRVKTLNAYAQKYGFKIKKIEFTNKIYSRPATGRGMFRSRLLRQAGASWEEIVNTQSLHYRLLGKLGSLLDRSLIHPRIEEYFGLCGNLVAILEKTGQVSESGR